MLRALATGGLTIGLLREYHASGVLRQRLRDSGLRDACAVDALCMAMASEGKSALSTVPPAHASRDDVAVVPRDPAVANGDPAESKRYRHARSKVAPAPDPVTAISDPPPANATDKALDAVSELSSAAQERVAEAQKLLGVVEPLAGPVLTFLQV